MRKIKRQRQGRGLALALCLCMLASVFPLASMTYAAEAKCSHKHDTAVCGYKVNDGEAGREGPLGGIEAAEGQPCTFAHEHDDSCGHAEGAEAALCSVEAAHVHDAAVCGYKEAVPGAPCTHSHDESCGGPQAKAGGQDVAAAAPMRASQRDAGYVLNNGKLTVTTNEGTTAWREAYAPRGVHSLEIGDQVTAIGDNAFFECLLMSSPTITLPAGLKSIGNSAFRATGLEEVVIPAGVEHIGEGAFATWNMKTISVEQGNQHFASEGNVLYSKDMSTLYAYPQKEVGTALTIRDSVEHIEDWVFTQYTSLESVKFPAGLKSIGNHAFQDCGKMTTIRFMGDVPPIIGSFGASNLKEIYYPAGAQGYTDGPLKGKTFIEIYRLTVERGVDETGGSPYDPGDRVTIAADTGPGKTFVGWRGGDDSVFADGSREEVRTTIIMPAEHLTLTVAYAEDEIKHSHSYGDWQHDDTHHWRVCSCGDITDKAVHNLGDWVTDKKPTDTDAGSRHRDCNTCGYRQTESLAPTGTDYEYRTLSDNASGVKVSGYFTDSGLLEVKEILLHLQGDCDVCDNIRQRQEKGEVIVLFDIGLKSGKYTGELGVEIPVGEQHNGQTVLMLHCKDKVLESRTVTVENGVVRGTFSSLSPYAVARVPSKTVITGLPESHTLLVGETVSWTPAPAGGQWSYDKDLLEMTKDKVNGGEAGREGPLGGGDTYTFKALKEGKAIATYTMNGVPHTVTITINSSTIPQTVDTVNSDGSPQTRDVSNLWLWTLLMLASLLGWGGLLYAKRSKKA